jgi:hypothetical protein
MLFLGLERDDNGVVGRLASETPLSEASDGAGGWAGLFTCLAGGPTKEDLACFPFVDCSP